MKQHATNIVRELRNRGFQAYFAGGCVRDMLLGLAPTDYDVATDATPPEVMRIFPETYAVGAQFGVVLVPLKHPLARGRIPPKQQRLGWGTGDPVGEAGSRAVRRQVTLNIRTTSRSPPFATMERTPTGAIPIR